MQTFTLIRAFRDFEIGTQFTRDEDNGWNEIVDGDEFEVSSSVMETLLDVGGYLEETTPVVWTPAVGSTVYVVTGAGEIKAKEFTNSDWFRLQNEFMGYFATREEAINRVSEVREMLHSAM